MITHAGDIRAEARTGARPRTDDEAEGNGTVGRVGEASLLTLGCRGENPGIFVSA